MEGASAPLASDLTSPKEKRGIIQDARNSSTSDANSSEVTYTDESDPDYSVGNGRITYAVKWKRRRKHHMQSTARWKARRIPKGKWIQIKNQEKDFQGSTLPVHCGQLEGVLYKEKLAAGVSHKSIKGSNGRWFTPSEFETEGGRESSKSWKRSIRYKGFPLQKLIDNGYLCNPLRRYGRRKKVKNPSRSFCNSAQFQSSDTITDAVVAQEPARGHGRTSLPQHVKLSCQYQASSCPTPAVVCHSGPEEAMPGPSSETTSVALQPPGGTPHKHLRVELKRLSPSVLTGARCSPLDSPQASRPTAQRTRRRGHRRSMKPHTLSSSLGLAILHAVYKMKQLFQNTFGNRKALQVKLRDINGHLIGLQKQHADLKKALDRCSQLGAALDVLALQKQMNGIIEHQRLLQTSVLKILTTLGIERPQL